MDKNEIIAIVKKKLMDQIDIESINIEDKSFLHKNHVGNQKGKQDFVSLKRIAYSIFLLIFIFVWKIYL